MVDLLCSSSRSLLIFKTIGKPPLVLTHKYNESLGLKFRSECMKECLKMKILFEFLCVNLNMNFFFRRYMKLVGNLVF